MKKNLFIHKVLLLYSITISVFTFIGITSQTPKVQAQDAITPTLYCLGACPTLSIGASPSVDPSLAVGTITPSTSTNPSTPVASETPIGGAPSINPQQPCPDAETSTKHFKKKHKGSGGFFEEFFRFLFNLLELLLRLSGGGYPQNPGCPPTPPIQPDPVDPPSVEPSEPAPTDVQPTVVQPTVVKTTPQPPISSPAPQAINLTNWKLQLPTGGNEKPTEIKTPQLATYSGPPWYVRESNGLRFRAAVNGVTTSGSDYPRSELREMINNGKDQAKWNTSSGTHTMIIEQAITAHPSSKKDVVAGQIHDDKDDVIVVRLEGKKLFIKVGDNQAGPTLDANYTFGKKFTIKFEVKGGKTSMYYNNGSTPVYTMSQSYTGAYFKAGAYTQSNCSKESNCSANNYGEVMIYRLIVTHQ